TSVTVIDGTNNSTVNVPTTGTDPNAIAINTVTNKIYVANFVSGNVTLISGFSNVTTNIAAGTNPGAVAVNPVTNKIYVANRASASVTVIDGTNNSPTTLTGFSFPYALAVNPATNQIYVANCGAVCGGTVVGNVTFLDGTTNAITPIPTPAATLPYAI